MQEFDLLLLTSPSHHYLDMLTGVVEGLAADKSSIS